MGAKKAYSQIFYNTPPIGILTNQVIEPGDALVTTAAGYLALATTATGLRAAGIAYEKYDTTGIASGVLKGAAEARAAAFLNSGADPVTIADIGNVVWLIDKNTIARTNPGGNTRSQGGRLIGFNDAGLPVVFYGAIFLTV